jgi:CheY-like chemotaxis protein
MMTLLIEDNASDARRISSLLAVRRISSLRVDSLSSAQMVLLNRKIDVILLDLSLPDSAGVDTVIAMHRVAPKTPIVVLSGHEDLEMARNCVRAGASSYVVKHADMQPESLERELMYAVERERRVACAAGFLHDFVEHGTLSPYVARIDEALQEVDTYLSRNHPSGAIVVSDILRRKHVNVAIQELRGIGKGTEALRIATVAALSRARDTVELKIPRRWLLAAYLCGIATGAAWWCT